jgi:PAS domain S-box-containing protein
MSGYTLDELVGRNTAIFITSDEDEIKLKEKLKLREQGISDGYEIEVMNKSGERRWWFVSGAPNYNDKNELIGSIGIHLDITEQKKLAKELEAAKISAEYAAKAKEVFLANMSHEIRTPLNVISGMVRELGKENLSAKQRDFVSHADVATEHLLTIINNILDMSKIESGEFELYNKDFSVEAVVGDVRSILFSKAHEKNLEFRIHLSPDIAKAHLGDPGRLRQILINLLGNSIKFTEKGYVSLDIDRVAQAPNYQTLKFTVVDTGIGMSEQFMHRLFDKFTQEEGATNRRFEGTGLGMSISKELVQLMGGEIQVTSMKGEGTKISFELQLPVGEEHRLVTKIDHKSDIEMAGARVLLVEDNEMNRFIAIQSLKQVGCVITEAVNGLDALEKVQSGQYDIILMDIQMPILDGVEATKEIRSKYDAEIPIIALTANAFKHDIDLYLSVGMNDYLIKPYKESELLEKLGMYLRRSSDDVEVSETLYDLSQLRELSRGDEVFINKMLSVFKSLAVQSIEQLEHGVEVNDWQEINRTAHKIKPSIDNLQINVISDKIRIVEKATEDQMTVDELKENVSEVITVLKKVVVSID